MNHHHLLTINYPKNGSMFRNSIILCAGYIENKSHECALCNYVVVRSSQAQNQFQVDINPKTRRFLCVIELQLGTDDIVFSYCCITTSVTVEFKESASKFHVIPLYIICEDHTGNFQAPDHENSSIESACKRITLGCKLLQAIFACKLACKSFTIDQRGCTVFHSKLRTAQAFKMNQLDLWQYFAREIMRSSLANVCVKYIAFLSCTKYNAGSPVRNNHDALIKQTDGYVAYGGEALALLGSACLYTWPENLSEVGARFSDETLVDTTKFLDDSCYRGTLGGCYATSLGAALHELCHTFDLGHSVAGIMGRGFNNVQQFFTNESCSEKETDAFWTKNQLALLNYHRWFNDYSDGKCYKLQYDAATRIIKSTAGICLVELRQGTDEKVIAYWVFDSKILKYSYQIQHEISTNEGSVVVVVEDTRGNILKQLFV